jgi:hypothetical protein
MLMLLARLSLRAGEVRMLNLEDIDWRAGELVARGKVSASNACLCLRMSARHWQRICDGAGPIPHWGRTEFVRTRAPHRALSSGGVTEAAAARGFTRGPPSQERPSTASHTCNPDGSLGCCTSRGRPGVAPSAPDDRVNLREGRPGGVAPARPSVAGRCVMSELTPDTRYQQTGHCLLGACLVLRVLPFGLPKGRKGLV